MIFGVDKIKALIGKRGGIAMSNRFSVFMSPPQRTLLNTDLSQLLSLPGAGLSGATSFVNDPRDIAFLCSRCSMPGKQITTMERKDLNITTKVPYDFVNEDVSFSFIVTEDYYMRKMFDRWMELIIDTEKYKTNYKNVYTTDVIVQQLSKTYEIPLYSVKLINAYPISITAIEFSNEEIQNATEINVTMTYDRWEPVNITQAVTQIANQTFGTRIA